MTESTLQRWAQIWHRLMALLLLSNLVLVGFNATYVPLRGLYLHYAPALVKAYDPLLGIEPQPLTQRYVYTVAQLERAVAKQSVAEQGLDADARMLLASLRQQSRLLMQENPYLASNQMPLFAQLKRRVRGFVGTVSAQTALERFWQPEYLTERWESALAFYHRQMEPLLRRSYYRETTETGQFVGEFWRIDGVFMVIFALELLGRTYWLSRRRPGIGWGDAIARHWYELPLLLPLWRWLRLVPTLVRLHRSGLVNVERLLAQVTHEPAAYLADRISKFLLVRLVNQTQESVKAGALLTVWQNAQNTREQPRRLDQLTNRLLQLVIYRVMPEIKPDLENLLRHSMGEALIRNDVYEGLQQVPGMDLMSDTALDALFEHLAQATCDVLAESYADAEGRELLERLSRDFRHAFAQELQDEATAAEIKTLLDEMLEELKHTYIQRSRQEDPEATLDEVERLHNQQALAASADRS